MLFISFSLYAAELTVHAAASLTDAMKEIGVAYEKESGDKLQFNFGASNMLARQIEEGAPADVFLSADEAKMDALEKKGLLLPGNAAQSAFKFTRHRGSRRRQPRRRSQPPIWPSLNARRSPSLKQSRCPPVSTRASISKSSDCGMRSSEKVVPTENVRAALAAVESGNVDAGIVYKTDALISKKVKVAVEISGAEAPKISYPIGVVKVFQGT